MRWQANIREIVGGLVWICLILATAAYGAAIVRNITETLQGIAGQSRSTAALARPYR